jgi:ferrous iron transport protein B
MMLIITLIAWSGALLTAKLLRMTIISGPSTPFVMELPPYRLPTLKGLLIHTWERTWQYVKKAGTIILGISVVLWALMTFPGLPDSKLNQFEAERQHIKASLTAPISQELVTMEQNENKVLSNAAQSAKSQLIKIDLREAEAALKNSVAGKIGTAMEPISKYAGFDWRTNIALVGGFAAKEIVVSTLGTAYSLGEVDPEDTSSLGDKLKTAPGWSPLVALCLILFTIFYAPCFVTVVAISREAGSWKWGAFSVTFNTTLAFTISLLVYQIGSYFELLAG